MPNNHFSSFLNSFINFESKLHQTSAQEFSLDDVKKLLDHLGRPDRKLKVIHIAGTKGKGSTSAMIAAILKEAGYSVGLYTSPHLYHLNERIRILKPERPLSPPLSQRGGGRRTLGNPPSLLKEGVRGSSCLFADSISDSDFNTVIQETRAAIEDVHRSSSRGLTFFEVLTAVVLYHFAKQKVDWVVLETGLGGRLDATNAVDSVVAVITPISLDHQNILGDTIAKIAAEKAGIIKSKFQKVIIAPQVPEVAEVLRKRCEELGITPVWAADNALVEFLTYENGRQLLNFKTPVCEYKDIQLSLAGAHQRINASTAVCASEVLRISFAAGRLNAAFAAMDWPGRFEIIASNPTVIVDCAHNEASIKALIETLQDVFPEKKVSLILGASQDKNIPGMARLLQNHIKCVILTQSNHPRAYRFTSEDTEKYFSGRDAVIAASVEEAVTEMRKLADRDDVVVITGSVFIAAEARKYYV